MTDVHQGDDAYVYLLVKLSLAGEHDEESVRQIVQDVEYEFTHGDVWGTEIVDIHSIQENVGATNLRGAATQLTSAASCLTSARELLQEAGELRPLNSVWLSQLERTIEALELLEKIK